MADQITPPDQKPANPPVSNPPPGSSTTDDTRAYSTLHNEFKEFKTAADAEKISLTAKVVELEKAAQVKTDGSKDSETLMKELNEYRTKHDALDERMKGYNEQMKKMLTSSEEGLTDSQKKLVAFSDADPFKRLSFITELKGQAPVTKTSQGHPIVDTGEVSLDIQYIANEADRGNLEPLHEAYKKYTKPVVQKWIAEKTTRNMPIPVPAKP